MSTQVSISPKILLSISSLYNDTNRIFMEYIDNSIDSADQYYFDSASNSYSREIVIVLKIDGKNAKDGSVTISDNCYGITNFTKIVSSIGNSDKKAQAWTNGQFGYGIYSFMAACEKLEVSSKLKDYAALYLPIIRKEFQKARQEDIRLPDPRTLKEFDYRSGTKIVLSEFDKDMWRGINKDFLKNEIQNHFEQILRRKNITIKLIDCDGNVTKCQPFDYDSISGDVYEEELSDFDEAKDGRKKSLAKIHVINPVRIFLKMTDGQNISRPPVFFSKGRRICEIKDVKSFKSNHKNDIWGHPNVTGFIDLHDMLGPTIARNDFQNTNESRALYQTLIGLEELIIDFVRKANIESEEKHYQQLEDVLSRALSRLARQEAMNYRSNYINGGETNLEADGVSMSVENIVGDSHYREGDEIENPGNSIFNDGDVSYQSSDNISSLPSDCDSGDCAKNQSSLNETDFFGQERKKSGFDIRISEDEPQINGLTGRAYRSIWDGSRIIIYKNHPDFQTRVRVSHQGAAIITDRLISYLASEITVHYKDLFYKKMQDGQPEYNKEMFESLVDFIYVFERSLKDYSGKNLSEF